MNDSLKYDINMCLYVYAIGHGYLIKQIFFS